MRRLGTTLSVMVAVVEDDEYRPWKRLMGVMW